MTGQLPFLVAGGGIGGLAAALALSIAGRRVIVVEQAEEFAEIGAGIQMGPNGFRMLEALGLRNAIDEAAVYPDDLIGMNGVTAKEITRIPVARGVRERFGYPYALVHRADLHRALLDACLSSPSIELLAGKIVEDFVEDGAGVTISIKDSASLRGCALVGADGLWSPIRAKIVGDGPPRVSGHIAYRAVLPIEDIEERFRQNAMILWAGPRNHLVQYPLRGGKLFNLVAVFHSDQYVEGWNREGDPEELYRRFAGNCEVVRTLLSKVETWRMWVLCDREPVRNWSTARVTLLGDAAHPMLQYLAQGACMALEDAVVLAQNVLTAGDNISAAFQTYQTQRYLRTGKCQIMARVYGAFYHAEGVTQELAAQFLGSRGPEAGVESLAWLYDFDPGQIGAGPVPTNGEDVSEWVGQTAKAV
ncbi:salicylate hydroxylase [Sphingobium sp. JAI105]|uniref:3-hydroxybenzoate 6-monooxygenase n=1 Tax=Sphingobium sp. JAI105 TaxID=2787715 RepID=UPI0018CBD41D|nr:3-hydroxybenzoate 6-monooxygenase [Sphingobium sp. JAI105]MBG6118487.1 salicylate hydroxylase [Sphingobium sp. JAI105]